MGGPKVCRIETTEKAIGRLVGRLGGAEGLAVCHEAGPGGYALWRLLTRMGVASQLATLDAQLEQIAPHERRAGEIDRLRAFRGISTLTALGLIAEIGDFGASDIRVS